MSGSSYSLRSRRTFVCRLVRLSFLPLIVREIVQRRRVTILLYHDPSVETMAKHLAALRTRYNVVPLRELVEAKRLGSLRRLPPKPLIITFDDGHRRNYLLKPLLERLGIPATIFLASGIVGTRRRFWFTSVADTASLKEISDEERIARLGELGFDEDADAEDRQALSQAEIEDMKPLIDFQSHTVSHPVLTRCGTEKARREIEGSRRELARRFGLSVYALAYPNGDYSERELALARQAGYDCAVTVDFGFNDVDTDLFRLRRICINDDGDGVDELIVKACGLWGLARKFLRRPDATAGAS
jgi:peptidoglycan/xylan/chitin deacetylase (PgdA/CDA1 family)